jgi:aminoglycoside phosphotransferase family enzyme
MLDRLLAVGEIDNAQMDALAALLAAFHGEAATGPGISEFGAPEAVAFNARENRADRAVSGTAGQRWAGRDSKFLAGTAQILARSERALS